MGHNQDNRESAEAEAPSKREYDPDAESADILYRAWQQQLRAWGLDVDPRGLTSAELRQLRIRQLEEQQLAARIRQLEEQQLAARIRQLEEQQAAPAQPSTVKPSPWARDHDREKVEAILKRTADKSAKVTRAELASIGVTKAPRTVEYWKEVWSSKA